MSVEIERFGQKQTILAIVGCTGQRRGKGLAVAGMILCTIPLVLGIIMSPLR